MGLLTYIAHFVTMLVAVNQPSSEVATYAAEKQARGAEARSLLRTELVAAAEDGFQLMDVVALNGPQSGVELHFVGTEGLMLRTTNGPDGKIDRVVIHADPDARRGDGERLFDVSDRVIEALRSSENVEALSVDAEGDVVFSTESGDFALEPRVGC